MNSELLYITRKLGYPSSFGTRSGLGDFLEQYPDGIYAETGAGAPMGWESAAVWFGGDSERAAARFERMMAERNELSRLFRTRVSGVLVITFIYRMKSRMVTAIPIGGSQPQPIVQTWLYFTMPQGGTVTLTKNGTPTEVTLEYSVNDGRTWTEWVETENVRSLTLAAGQTMHVRNASETSTGFSTSLKNNYRFSFSDDTYAGGNTNSLLCKNAESVTSLTAYCFFALFNQCTTLITAPELPATTLANDCYRGMFVSTNIVTAPELPATILVTECYMNMFYSARNLSSVTTMMTDISASSCLSGWLWLTETGDFYCPAELTIPTGASGIPSGWTRHDI